MLVSIGVGKLFHSSCCSCGETKDVTIKSVKGISTQIYNKSDLDISASLGFGLASISSKVSKESGESLTISTEQTVEDKTTFHALRVVEKLSIFINLLQSGL